MKKNIYWLGMAITIMVVMLIHVIIHQMTGAWASWDKITLLSDNGANIAHSLKIIIPKFIKLQINIPWLMDIIIAPLYFWLISQIIKNSDTKPIILIIILFTSICAGALISLFLGVAYLLFLGILINMTGIIPDIRGHDFNSCPQIISQAGLGIGASLNIGLSLGMFLTSFGAMLYLIIIISWIILKYGLFRIHRQ